MSEEMSDIAKIDYVSTIDFSKGFQRFHIKWPLKNLTKPKESSKFETTVTNGDRKITLEWSLGFGDFANDWKDPWFGAFLETSEKITPMIYRICLSSSTNVLFDSSDFVVMDGSSIGHGHIISPSVVDAYPTDDLLLQFWIDIPIGIAIGNNSDKLNKAKRIKLDLEDENSLQKACNDVLLLDHAKIFSHVVGADPDPTSDISVIIVKKKEEDKEVEEEEEEEERRFQCHTVFLSARSDVFERMFASKEWKENCVKDGRSVTIKDIDAQVMETLLKYIYTSTLPDPSIDHDHLYGIIFASDKYNLPELKKWCVGVLILKHDSIEDRIEQLILADRHNLAQLKAVCIAQLSLSFSTLSLDRDAVKEISSDLWSEIMRAVNDREMKTTDIVLPAA